MSLREGSIEMSSAELFHVLVRTFGVVLALGAAAMMLAQVIGPLSPLAVGILLMWLAGPITRGFYGSEPFRD